MVDIVIYNWCVDGDEYVFREVANEISEYKVTIPNLYGNLGGKYSCWDSRSTGNSGKLDYGCFEQGASAGNVGKEKMVELKKANPVAFCSSRTVLP
ncbi:hypothetical protein NC652_022415 [Populus alba x Populus x berolinensis]|nr:hypothetical protein NC652_022415 [Populus alba x Populus x berolinensis]